jgi:hypothetical protein
LYKTHSDINHPIAPTAPATIVTKKALAVMPSAATSLPALNPNQPNYNKVAPRTVSIGEKGLIATLP